MIRRIPFGRFWWFWKRKKKLIFLCIHLLFARWRAYCFQNKIQKYKNHQKLNHFYLVFHLCLRLSSLCIFRFVFESLDCCTCFQCTSFIGLFPWIELGTRFDVTRAHSLMLHLVSIESIQKSINPTFKYYRQIHSYLNVRLDRQLSGRKSTVRELG